MGMEKDLNINFFRPVGDFMTKDVNMKKLVLIIWGVATYGFLILLVLVGDPNVTTEVTLNTGEVVTQVAGKSFLTETTFLGFPFHYWYSAQFCIILYIFLCWWYCKFIDKLEAEHSK
jgi:putative solute:sodium symporter small subunit